VQAEPSIHLGLENRAPAIGMARNERTPFVRRKVRLRAWGPGRAPAGLGIMPLISPKEASIVKNFEFKGFPIFSFQDGRVK
jgi:hypothetical protein